MKYRISDGAILVLILGLGAALRFFQFHQIPFTHDEFSALSRLRFSSFFELIAHGVKTDGHPAGVQVFLYYYTKLFGQQEWVVKLPFAIFGMLSILLVYQVAKMWTHSVAALLSAAYFASIQYTVMYSQIARPYISGLFFSLLMVFFLSRIIHHKNKNVWANLVFFSLSGTLCAYNHHFSLLFAALVGVVGLFFVPRELRIKYIFAGGAIFLLYIPHLPIFIYQLKKGGVEGWLAKPTPVFLLEYLQYIFQYSWISIVLALGIVVLGFFKPFFGGFDWKKYLVFILLFLVPFAVGYFYSLYRNSVLQYSVLIFGFPFLYLILFGHMRIENRWALLGLVVAVLGTNTYALVVYRQHYRLFYSSPYEGIVKDWAATRAPGVISLLNSNRGFTDYYLEKHGLENSFVDFNKFESERDFKVFLVENAPGHNAMFFGHLSFLKSVYVPMILEYFPKMEWQKNYAGATTYLFSKGEASQNVFLQADFGELSSEWENIKPQQIIGMTTPKGEKKGYVIMEGQEFGPAVSFPLQNFLSHKNNCLDIALYLKRGEAPREALIVVEIEQEGENVFWGASEIGLFDTTGEDGWHRAHFSVKMSDLRLDPKTANVRAYIWNQGKSPIYFTDFTIYHRKGNPVIYGLYERVSK